MTEAPPGYLEYSSSDESVIEVFANGAVRARGDGIAYILAERDGVRGFVSISVGYPDDYQQLEIQLLGFGVYPESVALVPDDTRTLVVTRENLGDLSGSAGEPCTSAPMMTSRLWTQRDG